MGDKKGKKENARVLAPLQCQHKSCHAKPIKHNFCLEHFDQFKFGLINKRGEMVPDYEKKMEHFMRQKARAA